VLSSRPVSEFIRSLLDNAEPVGFPLLFVPLAIAHHTADFMNYVQHLPAEKYGNIFITLNPPYTVDPDTVFRRIMYEHPVIDGKVSNSNTFFFEKVELLILSLQFHLISF
jgi:hypothetical protein